MLGKKRAHVRPRRRKRYRDAAVDKVGPIGSCSPRTARPISSRGTTRWIPILRGAAASLLVELAARRYPSLKNCRSGQRRLPVLSAWPTSSPGNRGTRADRGFEGHHRNGLVTRIVTLGTNDRAAADDNVGPAGGPVHAVRPVATRRGAAAVDVARSLPCHGGVAQVQQAAETGRVVSLRESPYRAP